MAVGVMLIAIDRAREVAKRSIKIAAVEIGQPPLVVNLAERPASEQFRIQNDRVTMVLRLGQIECTVCQLFVC
jgi:hypothetical protein